MLATLVDFLCNFVGVKSDVNEHVTAVGKINKIVSVCRRVLLKNTGFFQIAYFFYTTFELH